MESIHKKYAKYKKKYLMLKDQQEVMHGGLIGQIPPSRLSARKKDYSISEKIKKYVNLITVPNTTVIPVGSSMSKMQPYFSDVDIMNIVEIPLDTDNLIRFFIDNLKKIISNATNKPNVFFSDFKAGGLHWTVNEIFTEQKDGISLSDACKKKDVIKIDIIAPYNERYVEMSTFFILKSSSGYVNIGNDYFSNLQISLLEDINQYKTIKPFKAIKRVWSLSKAKNDLNTLNKLKYLVRSNIALMAQINADIETLVLLIEHDSKYNLDFVINELDAFKDRIAQISDIDYDEEKIDVMVDRLIVLFKFNKNTEDDKKNLLQALEQMHDYLLSVINKETLEYLSHINFNFKTYS